MNPDPTNDQRAIWARISTDAYAQQTSMDTAGETLPTVLEDMLGSIMHLCDLEQIDFNTVLTGAYRLYADEVEVPPSVAPIAALENGVTYDLGRGVVATVTGRCKVGYTANQEYRGKVYPIIIPDSKVGNPHYTITRMK